jgi:hypothetical protein
LFEFGFPAVFIWFFRERKVIELGNKCHPPCLTGRLGLVD